MRQGSIQFGFVVHVRVEALCELFQWELFQQEYGPAASAPTASAPAFTPLAKSARQSAIERKLVILDWLGPRVSVAPSGASPLSAWIGTKLAHDIGQHLRLGTLAELAGWINAQGRWWYRQVPGLGRARAERLVAWLADRCEPIGVALDKRVLKTVNQHVETTRPASTAVSVSVHTCLVPMEQLAWPPGTSW